MDERQRIAVNALVGFGLTTGLAILFQMPIGVAVVLGAVAAVGFAAGIWLVSKFEQRQAA